MTKVHSPECQNVEFKEIWRDDYLKWVCGFANAHRGRIYIGVIDGSHDAHKNYMGPAIQMHIYDDRIELWNDGNLPEGYNEETLYGSHPSMPRNPKIASTMFKAGLIDTWGRGYRKIYTGFKNSGLPIPTVRDHFSGVQITIQRTVFQQLNSNVGNNVGNNVGKDTKNSTKKKITDRYNSIKELMISNPYITAAQLSEELSVSDRTIERDIAKMQEFGVLIREGDKNGGRWIIIK